MTPIDLRQGPHKRMQVYLPEPVFDKLLADAHREFRPPKDHVTLLLSQALGFVNDEDTGQNLGGSPVSSVRTA